MSMPSDDGIGGRAWFFDGHVARKQPVIVETTGEALIIRNETGHRVAVWAWSDLSASQFPGTGNSLQVGAVGDPDARLVIDDPALVQRLVVAAPHMRRPRPRGMRLARNLVLAVAGIALLGVATFYGVPRLSGPLARIVPIHWELAIGEAIKKQLIAGAPVCGSEAGKAALGTLVERLTKNVAVSFPLDVTVVNRDIENAFAGPGGHIVVMSALLDAAESPDEVAGILAHEIGHVVERHPLKGAIRLGGITLLVQLVLGGGSDIVESLAQMGGILVAFSHGRDDERAADRYALRLLERAAVSPAGLARFFERLAEGAEEAGDRSARRVATLFSTHPWSDERLRAFRNAATGTTRPALGEAAWQALRDICR